MSYEIGDIVLIQRNTKFPDIIPLIIQVFSRCRWNHTALIIDRSGRIIHAHRKGVTRDYIEDLENEKIILRMNLTDHEKWKIADYAIRQVGKKFNWFTFIGLSYARQTRIACTDLIRDAYLSAGIELNLWMPREIIYDKRFKKVNFQIAVLRYTRKGKCNRCGQCCIEEKCEYLEIKNDMATCKIYNNPDRPLKCKLFPEMPPIPKLFKSCGYYFLDTWEDSRIVKQGSV